MKRGMPVFLRDLNDTFRQEEEEWIAEHGSNKLKEALKNGWNIKIGEYFSVENYQVYD